MSDKVANTFSPAGGIADNVNPQMIMLARQARRFTQASLASEMKVAQATVSKIEAGILSPTDDDLRKLANILGFPPQFFTQSRPIPGPGMSELFHRKRQRLGVKALNRVYANATIQIMNIEDLLRSWEFSFNDIPNMPLEHYEDNPEKIARTVRAMWQLPPGPVHNVTETIERFGCLVVADDFESDYIDGFSRCAYDTPPLIFMNSRLKPDRWRWTLTHELGHIIMHSAPQGEDHDIEREADRFAGEFLAPSYEIKPQLYGLTIKKLPQLKRYWKISMQALLMRANHAGAINERQKRYMFMQLSKAGYRKREPAELDPPIETPEMLDRIITYHTNNLGYSMDELLTVLRIEKPDFLQLFKPQQANLKVVR